MTKRNESSRAKYIREHYWLTKTPGGTWRAEHYFAGMAAFMEAATREEACRLARCEWGHFNFQDEADAFGEIFR